MHTVGSLPVLYNYQVMGTTTTHTLAEHQPTSETISDMSLRGAMNDASGIFSSFIRNTVFSQPIHKFDSSEQCPTTS